MKFPMPTDSCSIRTLLTLMVLWWLESEEKKLIPKKFVN